MSGHSKWSTIKHQKATKDKRRAQVFEKLIRAVAAAAKEGGNDPALNSRLRLAIDRARSFNVPKDRIERALRKEGNETIESFAFDAIGPGGVTMIIEGATDNRNRTLGEVRQVLLNNGAKLAQEGSARWAFLRRGLLLIEKTQDATENEKRALAAIAAGTEDLREDADHIEASFPLDAFESARKRFEDAMVPIIDAALAWVPQQTMRLGENDRTALEKLLSSLDEHPDVQTVWTNEA